MHCGSCRTAGGCSCHPAKSFKGWLASTVEITTSSSIRPGKQLTFRIGHRRSGAPRAADRPHLEYAAEFIADDELVEVTPASIRICKRFKEYERKKEPRSGLMCLDQSFDRRAVGQDEVMLARKQQAALAQIGERCVGKLARDTGHRGEVIVGKPQIDQ